jgi:hypothetical protein
MLRTDLTLYCSYLAAIVTCLALFIKAVRIENASFKYLLPLGPGAIDTRTLLTWSLPDSGASGLIANTIVANLPQLVLSVLYYTYNGLFTSFMLSYEWDGLSTHRKPLRVSHDPIGAQRTTHFLQVPYKFAGPLMTLSGVLHWFCAGSLFLVTLQAQDSFGSISEKTTCGYSPSGLLGLILLGTFMLTVAFCTGNRTFKSSIPSVGSCSAAISAMVHPPAEEPLEDAAYLPVQWGVTRDESIDVDGEKIGHCSVSSLEVKEPKEGCLYAGS